MKIQLVLGQLGQKRMSCSQEQETTYWKPWRKASMWLFIEPYRTTARGSRLYSKGAIGITEAPPQQSLFWFWLFPRYTMKARIRLPKFYFDPIPAVMVIVIITLTGSQVSIRLRYEIHWNWAAPSPRLGSWDEVRWRKQAEQQHPPLSASSL